MALTDENGGGTNTTMLVQPSGFGGNDGFMGGNGWWIILLFILLGGWGNGFGGNGGGMYGGGLYPWMNQSNQISDGFRDQMLNDNITSIRDGVYGINNQLCTGFAGVNATVNGAQNALAQQLYTNQIADMQQNFALQSQLAQCCCDNRAATADLKYVVATENCADRTAAAQNTRDIIDSQTRGTQAIIDKLCALELQGVRTQLEQAQRENVGLQNQLNMAALRESQTAQNAFIQQGFSNEVDALYNRLNSCPVPTTPVYGRTPIFTCGGQTVGCGCGGNFAA
jgi:hypothetical protein